MASPWLLPSSRRALRAAMESVTTLLAAQADDERFKALLPNTLASLDVVTSRIDKDTAGRRTPAFAKWWGDLAADPRRAMMHRLRNDEFKEGRITHHQARFGQFTAAPRRTAPHSSTSVIVGGTNRPSHRPPRPGGVSYLASHIASQGTIARITDNDHGGVLLIDFITDYLTWLDATVVPTAEQLMLQQS